MRHPEGAVVSSLTWWSRRLESIVDHVDRFGFSMCDALSDEIVTDQKGAFRTNCLDWCVTMYPNKPPYISPSLLA